MIARSLALISALLLALVGAAAAAERVDLFDTKGTRTGYAIVDRQTGRVDFYDVQSRRTGYGRIAPSGTVERFGLNGQRQGETVLPVPLKQRGAR